jgi:hypothetical protein
MQHQNNNNNKLMYAIIFGVIFFMFILPEINKNKCINSENMTSLINQESHKIKKLDTNKCSTDCCLHTQWPVPHIPENTNSKYIGSNFMCNGNNGSGCLCVTKDDINYITHRALNV